MTNEQKEFDAVKLMRESREQLSIKYWQHPELLKQDLDEIRKKYSSFVSENDKSPEEATINR